MGSIFLSETPFSNIYLFIHLVRHKNKYFQVHSIDTHTKTITTFPFSSSECRPFPNTATFHSELKKKVWHKKNKDFFILKNQFKKAEEKEVLFIFKIENEV